jgi:hypothetical protein
MAGSVGAAFGSGRAFAVALSRMKEENYQTCCAKLQNHG